MEDGTQAEVQRRILEIGARVALVAAGNAPRLASDKVTSSSGFAGELQHSVKVSAFSRGASVYSNAIYGGVQNVGSWTKRSRPSRQRASASHYMDRAVTEAAPWVEQEINSVMEWLMTTFQA